MKKISCFYKLIIVSVPKSVTRLAQHINPKDTQKICSLRVQVQIYWQPADGGGFPTGLFPVSSQHNIDHRCLSEIF